MPILLAKLADLKADLGETSSALDALLTRCLEAASSMAERAAGVRDGGLRREVDAIEYPGDGSAVYSRRLLLDRRPIESISEIVELWRSSSDAEFDEATPLVLDEDYLIDSIDLGVVSRLGSDFGWYVGERRTVRVTYTAGFVDPATAEPPATAILPPADLQRGVIAQAIQIYNQRDKAGLRYINAGNSGMGGGQTGFAEPGTHPLLLSAAQRYRRLM